MEGKELKAIRKSMRVSVVDAAKLLGVTRSTIYNWENEEVPIPASKEVLIRRVFDLDGGVIIMEEDIKGLCESAVKKFDQLMECEHFKNRVQIEGYKIALNLARGKSV